MRNKGITLIEVLIVVGLITTVVSLGLFVNMDNYNNSSFRSERDQLISVLMHARAEAMNNTCISTTTTCVDGKAHGVHIVTSGNRIINYVIFQGMTYDSLDNANEIIKANYKIDIIEPTKDINFTQLSGNSNYTVIKLADNEHNTSDIIVGSEGQISWTH